MNKRCSNCKWSSTTHCTDFHSLDSCCDKYELNKCCDTCNFYVWYQDWCDRYNFQSDQRSICSSYLEMGEEEHGEIQSFNGAR